MNNYKVQLHCHSGSDPEDCLFHSDKDVIDRAALHGYDVLALTCHNTIVHTKELEHYAKKKGILLLPGVEKTVEKKHVLIVNAAKEAEFVHTFTDLETYKKNHPQSLIIAPHPYHPLPIKLVSLGDYVEQYAHLFDAIEWSSFYSRYGKFNKKAQQKAKKLNIPMIGTADNHVLRYLNHTFSLVRAPQKTTHDIVQAIKKGHIEIQTKPMNLFMLGGMTARLLTLEYGRKALRHITNRFRNSR